jgi:hypothetical protein
MHTVAATTNKISFSCCILGTTKTKTMVEIAHRINPNIGIAHPPR